MKGEPTMETLSPKNQTPPHLAKERIMTGGQTEGVPEIEDLTDSLKAFLDSVTTLSNFEMTLEWQAWKAYENKPQTPDRVKAKAAVMGRLAAIEKAANIGSKDIMNAIAFYRAEIVRK